MGNALWLICLLSPLAFYVAQAAKHLVVFGDSYSDVGNLQRLTNGPLWSEDLAVGWNASLYSFAFDGAVCDNALFSDNSTYVPSIRDQVEAYYNQQLDLDPEETIYAFWIGINDIERSFQLQDPSTSLKNTVACLSQQLKNVRKVFGSNRFIVINAPPLDRMPYFAGTDNEQSRADATNTLNTLLSREVTKLNKHHHALELDLVDVYAMLNDMVEKPDEFGFKDATHAYWDACQGRCTDAVDSYVWWDEIHLTGGAHRAVANSILLSGSLEPPVSVDVTADAQAQLEADPRFQSAQYEAKPHTDIVDKKVAEIIAAKAAESSSSSSSNDDAQLLDWDDDESDGSSFNSMYFVLTVTALLCVGFVWFARRQKRSSNLSALSGLVKNNTRGRFVPLRNMDNSV
ncbi:GDSL-like Lipase/Acylhydrolase-domain-containing protein [Syncephalastrum racemosum]|uniref:GDSL-like Lipase/Acylhydrolase-domain-containing protein n=1 Tax=Syncephalastrum racemosum TaxID=13706 RepID=A0A1X2H3B7_SYNRA|nr:GDSL-like Lipase/Acylhydrolase-domain-containing protein [Syncephalastrum racemosum]